MPKGYVILTEVIRDPEGMYAYGRAAGPSLAEGGATVLVADPVLGFSRPTGRPPRPSSLSSSRSRRRAPGTRRTPTRPQPSFVMLRQTPTR